MYVSGKGDINERVGYNSIPMGNINEIGNLNFKVSGVQYVYRYSADDLTLMFL